MKASPVDLPDNVIRMGAANRTPRKGGPSGGGTTVDTETKNYVDAKTEATRAQNDARFTEVLTKLDEKKPMTWQQCAAIVASGLGIMLAILSFAGDRFDGGMSHGETVGKDAAETRAIAVQNTAAVEALSTKVEETTDSINDLVDILKKEQERPKP